jgi:hypothetical protein
MMVHLTIDGQPVEVEDDPPGGEESLYPHSDSLLS